LHSSITVNKEEEDQFIGNQSIMGRCRQDTWHLCAAARDGSDSERVVEGSGGPWGSADVGCWMALCYHLHWQAVGESPASPGKFDSWLCNIHCWYEGWTREI